MKNSEKNTVLVVDDEVDILNLTQKFLKLADFNTITTSNGKEAMKILEKRYDEIALVLLDIMMPGLSGYQCLEEIKEHEKYEDIPIILFTVKSFNEDIQKGKKLGADGYLTKPFSGKELVKYIEEKLEIKP
ncbi:MAG: response regulator [Promethearchaeia archaeon]